MTDITTETEIDQTGPILGAALQYAELGLPVFPCKRGGKVPLTKNGFKDATIDPDNISAGGEQWEQLNIAIATSGSIFVLDVDPRHEGDKSLDDLFNRYGPLPPTMEAMTGGGGRHFYYADPTGKARNSTSKVAKGVDIKGEGGYVIAPPSVHPSGTAYRWVDGKGPGEIEIAEAPEWLLAMVHTMDGEADIDLGDIEPAQADDFDALYVKPSSPPSVQSPEYRSAVASAKVAAEKDPAIQGKGGDKQTYTIVGQLYRTFHTLTKDDIFTIIKEHYSPKCIPSWDDKLIHHKVDCIFKTPRTPSSKTVATPPPAVYPYDDGIDLDTIEMKQMQWLWLNRLPLGNLSVLYGDACCGKSHITLDLVARVTASKPWADDVPMGAAGGAIIVTGEDGMADTIIPRLAAMGADLAQVRAIQTVHALLPNGTAIERGFCLADIMPLENVLNTFKSKKGVDCKLVVIDPISSFMGGTDSHRDSDVRGLLTPLQKLAEKYYVAIVIVAHTNKQRGVRAANKLSGSLGFYNACRSAFYVAKHPEEDGAIMCHVKHNCTVKQPTLGYVIVPAQATQGNRTVATSAINWTGVVDVTADEAMMSAEELPTKIDECVEWLEGYLGTTERPAKDVCHAGKTKGYSGMTIRRAKDKLSVVSVKGKGRFASSWVWSLPRTEPIIPHRPGAGLTDEDLAFDQ